MNVEIPILGLCKVEKHGPAIHFTPLQEVTFPMDLKSWNFTKWIFEVNDIAKEISLGHEK